VNIREYYDVNGELRPSKKGISLRLEEWRALLIHLPKIEAKLYEYEELDQL